MTIVRLYSVWLLILSVVPGWTQTAPEATKSAAFAEFGAFTVPKTASTKTQTMKAGPLVSGWTVKAAQAAFNDAARSQNDQLDALKMSKMEGNWKLVATVDTDNIAQGRYNPNGLKGEDGKSAAFLEITKVDDPFAKGKSIFTGKMDNVRELYSSVRLSFDVNRASATLEFTDYADNHYNKYEHKCANQLT